MVKKSVLHIIFASVFFLLNKLARQRINSYNSQLLLFLLKLLLYVEKTLQTIEPLILLFSLKIFYQLIL